jgi:adenylate cyclase
MRASLRQVFAASVIAGLSIIGWALGAFLERSRQAALAAAERSRRAEATRVEARVARALGVASTALDNLEHALTSGAVDRRDARALEGLLYTQLLGSPHVAEVTFSAAVLTGFAAGEPTFAPDGRFQLSVFRRADGAVATRNTAPGGGGFVAREQVLDHAARFAVRSAIASFSAPDPTIHPTFLGSVALGPEGGTLWSDLHYSELDDERARVVLTVQKALWLPSGDFLGVARVGLLTSDIDAITEDAPEAQHAEEGSPALRVALLAVSARDGRARLVARVSPEDRVVPVADDLRIEPVRAPPELLALLESPIVQGLDAGCPARDGSLEVLGEPWLATLSPLSIDRGGTAGWLVAVLAPEQHYTREVSALGRQLAGVFAATAGLLLLVGGAVLWSVRRGLLQLGELSRRMREFDFRAGGARSSLSDVQELIDGLERAKTATRALCKYVPVPLVRRLHEQNRDPELGGEVAELTLLFSDIQGFTSLAEQLAPDALARCLGRYLQESTDALEAYGATIDKYIGDAVMAFWNAPTAAPRHSLAACRGVLACQQALKRLYSSAEWQGLPRLVTRFGLHRAQVLVGHFGAVSRLSYTALGDGVNLASRLEGLCKQYGVTVLATDAVVAEAGAEMAFRRVDRVIVSGKHEPVEVHELLGAGPLPPARRALVEAYEAALEAYVRRDFAGARALLAPLLASDAPSRVLDARCARHELEPPPDWNGVHLALSK